MSLMFEKDGEWYIHVSAPYSSAQAPLPQEGWWENMKTGERLPLIDVPEGLRI